jgi:YHS domain-containing protein
MKRIGSLLAILIGVAVLAAAAVAADDGGQKVLVNVDKSGVAIKGHDPVVYFTEGRSIKGKPDLTARHQGATYRFATEENRRAFEQDPAKYAPAFGGYCGYGLAQGYLAPVSPDAFQIIDGRLILQYNRGAAAMFAKDVEGNLAKADANWPGLVQKHGK